MHLMPLPNLCQSQGTEPGSPKVPFSGRVHHHHTEAAVRAAHTHIAAETGAETTRLRTNLCKTLDKRKQKSEKVRFYRFTLRKRLSKHHISDCVVV